MLKRRRHFVLDMILFSHNFRIANFISMLEISPMGGDKFIRILLLLSSPPSSSLSLLNSTLLFLQLFLKIHFQSFLPLFFMLFFAFYYFAPSFVFYFYFNLCFFFHSSFHSTFNGPLPFLSSVLISPLLAVRFRCKFFAVSFPHLLPIYLLVFF